MPDERHETASSPTSDNDTHEDNDATDNDEVEERLNLQRTLNAFRLYARHSYPRLKRAFDCYDKLSEEHKKLLVKHQKHLETVAVCIRHNSEVLTHVVSDTENMFENKTFHNTLPESKDDNSDNEPLDGTTTNDAASVVGNLGEARKQQLQQIVKHMMMEPRVKPTATDIEKVQSVLKQFVREWSLEGKRERDQSYLPILDALDRTLGLDVAPGDRYPLRVLVPGAGLGRLVFEIVHRGYSCCGNEYSLFMLIPSNFIINHCPEPDVLTIYPFVHQFTNNLCSGDQTRPITFPDIAPRLAANPNSKSEFSMSAGNFLTIYNTPNEWDSVCTCFFLDTAANVIDYIEKIHFLLKPGGYWINLGPLLYHYADMCEHNSIEPSYELVKDVIGKMGFVFVEERLNVETHYAANVRSMLVSSAYKSVFFVCRKNIQ